MCIDILFLAWAQIYFLDTVSFVFSSAFFILFVWHLPNTPDLLFKLFFTAAERGSTFSEAQPSLQNTKWFLLSEMRTSNILQNLSVWMSLRATTKGLWAFVVVWFFSCNRLWDESWHCFSCDTVAGIGTAGLWDSPLMSAPQDPQFYELTHPVWEKTQCADVAIKVISIVERLLLKGRQEQSRPRNVEAREILWKGQRETKSGA